MAIRLCWKVVPLAIIFSLIYPNFFIANATSPPTITTYVTFLSTNLNQHQSVEIPEGYTLKSITPNQYIVVRTPDVKPLVTFPTTNQTTDFQPSEPVYYEPYYYEVLKKGRQEYVDIFVPSQSYQDEYRLEPIKYVFAVTYEQSDEPTMPLSPMTTYDYLIITSTALWSTFNNNFKAWKLANDPKITNILITNVSDIVNMPQCWVNGTYGDAKNISQGNHWIPNGKQIRSSYSMFNDTQCKIRNYIRYCYDNYDTRYVMLAGNRDNVPVRMACSYAHAGPGGTWWNDTSHACDMYYSCLDYCMNNNTNSRWMENNFAPGIWWAHVPVWDEIDWGFDVTVGRLLISSTTEANRWITKEKEYVNGNDLSKGNYLNNWIIAAKDASSHITNFTWNLFKNDLPSNVTFVNGKNITQAQWNNLANYCNGVMPGFSGINILHHSGHGGSETPYTASNLNNSVKANFFYTEGCDTAEFGDSSCTMEQLFRDDGGPVAAIGNSAYGWFEASSWYGESMFSNMFNTSNELCFAKSNDFSREDVGHTLHSVCPMIVKELNFFGDPSLEYKWYNPAPVNYAPLLSNENPVNGSINRDTSFLWSVQINDNDADLMQWYIECNNTQQNSGSSYNTTINLGLTGLSYSKPYTVLVNVSDGTTWTRKWYTFTTKSMPPMVPENNSDYEKVYNMYFNYTATKNGAVSFYWGNGTFITTIHNMTIGSIASIYLPDYINPDWLSHDTTYYWYVIDNGTESPTYDFHTSKPWDTNEDRTVNYLDMSALSSAYRETVIPGSIGADVNSDGTVNYLDASAIGSNYRATY